MKYLKLFEHSKIHESEYPENGYGLSSREEKILKDLVGDYLNTFNIKKEDGYYYVNHNHSSYYNRFDDFNYLKDYIQLRYFYDTKVENVLFKVLELLKTTKLDMSFDYNISIKWASGHGHTEIVKLLLQDPRVDPSADNNQAIKRASESGHTEVVKLLLKDPRVDPSAGDNWAITLASEKGRKEVVKILLRDPRVIDKLKPEIIDIIFRLASRNGHIEVVKLLLNDYRVRAELTPEQINKYRNEIS